MIEKKTKMASKVEPPDAAGNNGSKRLLFLTGFHPANRNSPAGRISACPNPSAPYRAPQGTCSSY